VHHAVGFNHERLVLEEFYDKCSDSVGRCTLEYAVVQCSHALVLGQTRQVQHRRVCRILRGYVGGLGYENTQRAAKAVPKKAI